MSDYTVWHHELATVWSANRYFVYGLFISRPMLLAKHSF